MIFNNDGVQGADLSFYQDDNATPQQVNFFKQVEHGASFVIIRAGQNAWVDPDFAYNWEKAKSAGLPRGSYWYYDSRYDPVKQAEIFANLFATDKPEMELWLDLEESYGGLYSGNLHWKKFLTRLKELLPGVRVGIYTNYYYFTGKISSSDYTFYKQFPLWLAWYAVDPSVVMIPLPWTSCLFWQWGTPAWGLAWGCESREIDMNLFNGTKADFETRYKVSSPDQPYRKIRAYSSDVYVLILDPKRYRFHVTNTQGKLQTVSDACRTRRASFGINADMWNKIAAAPYYPDSLATSDGVTYHAQEIIRPFLTVSRDGVASISSDKSESLYNTASGVRYIVKDGNAPTYLYGTDVQYVERHPRTAGGVRADGKVVLVVVDGRSEISAGVKLLELAQIMIQYGCVNAIDFDGGGSSAMWVSDRIVNVPRDIDGSQVERAVVNHIIAFNGVEQMAKYNVVSLNYNMTLRPEHNTGVTGTESVPAGTPMLADLIWTATEDLYKVINGINTKINQVGDQWAHVISVNAQVKDSWVAVIHKGLTYCTYTVIPDTTPSTHTIEVYVDGVLEYKKEF